MHYPSRRSFSVVLFYRPSHGVSTWPEQLSLAIQGPACILNSVTLTLGFVLALLGLAGLAEGLSRTGILPSWVARKLLHMGVGALVLLFARTGQYATLAWVAVAFAFLNLTERIFHLTSISRSEKSSWGTVLFPLSVAWMALVHPGDPIFPYALGVMFFADPLAAFFGRAWPIRRLGPKSLGGSLGFFLAASSLGLLFFPFPQALLLALLATLVEGVSERGLDNLLLPLLLALWVEDLALRESVFFTGLVFASTVAVLAWRFRALTPRAATAAGILGLVIWEAGGWSWALPVLVFFVLGSLAARLRGRPSETRTPVQVLANGWVPGTLAYLHALHPSPALAVGYLAAVCEAAADTLATETGGPQPRDILTRAPVPRGASGGVTLQGFLGGLGGAVAVGGTAWMLGYSAGGVGLAVLAGFLGSVVDSLLGARLQGRWRCRVCGKEVEMPAHCGQPGIHLRGLAFLDNNGVNALASLVAGAGGWALWPFLNS